jgi:NAD+ kinase
MKKFRNILLLHKKTAYSIYFLNPRSSFLKNKKEILAHELNRFESAHREHHEALKIIRKVLREKKLNFKDSCRGRKLNYKKFDLIITVGGDGTFLEAGRNSTHQMIIGVNSSPRFSVGRFCVADAENFESIFDKVLGAKFEMCELQRLSLRLEGCAQKIYALNDILICHSNPAVLCRYNLQIGGRKEEQRSSGIWISTPAGSSGASYSAGGKLLTTSERKFQYIPRELYRGKLAQYQLKGAVLPAYQKIKITSLMRRGMIFVDGAHWSFPFEYGQSAEISFFHSPIRTIRVK